MIDMVVERGMGVVNAAVPGGGILATGAGASNRYGYREAPEVLLDAIREIEARDPRIATTVVGVSRPERIAESVAAIELDIPDGLFDEIDRIAAAPPTDIGPR